MNPPFSNRLDAQHIKSAWDRVKPGGKLVAIAGEGVFFGSDKKAQEFRQWLDDNDATVEMLPGGTFSDKSLQATTDVNARLIVMDKPKSAQSMPEQNTGPHDGDIDKNGLVFKNGRWHRENKEQVKETTPLASADEYPYSQAQRAYQHSNRYGAKVAREEYVKSINAAYEKLNNGLNEEQKKYLDDAFVQLKKDYLEKEKPVLSTRSGIVSAHIAGHSNFKSSLASRGQSAHDKTISDHEQWFKSAISDIENGLKKRRNDTQEANDEKKLRLK